MPVDDSKLSFEFPAEFSHLSDEINCHESLYKYSIENREEFWSTLAKNRLEWIQMFDTVTDSSFESDDVKLKWFLNGKINVSGIEKLFCFL